MDLRVLGELSVHEGGVPISPPAAATRQVLALLAASADQVVPTCAIAEELWSERAPAHAEQILQTHVRQLRAVIGRALQAQGSVRTAEEVLAWVPGGYRLDTGGGSSDARAFERTAGAGYRAMDAGNLDLASRRLREALDLWTAAPFAGVAQGPQLRSQADLLTGSWQRVVDRWIDVDFRLGRWRELCADLARVLTRFCPPALLYVQLKADLDTKGQDPEVIKRHLRRRRNASTFTAYRTASWWAGKGRARPVAVTVPSASRLPVGPRGFRGPDPRLRRDLTDVAGGLCPGGAT